MTWELVWKVCQIHYSEKACIETRNNDGIIYLVFECLAFSQKSSGRGDSKMCTAIKKSNLHGDSDCRACEKRRYPPVHCYRKTWLVGYQSEDCNHWEWRCASVQGLYDAKQSEKVTLCSRTLWNAKINKFLPKIGWQKHNKWFYDCALKRVLRLYFVFWHVFFSLRVLLNLTVELVKSLISSYILLIQQDFHRNVCSSAALDFLDILCCVACRLQLWISADENWFPPCGSADEFVCLLSFKLCHRTQDTLYAIRMKS